MDTLLTIVIWLGSGFAFAGGFFLGLLVMAPTKQWKGESREQTALMKERNEIDHRKVAALEKIAERLIKQA